MTRVFDAAARWLSRPWVCACFIAVLVPALAYGFYDRWSTGYVLALTLFLSVMSYVVPFVFLYSQARGDAATHAKLDELIRVTEGSAKTKSDTRGFLQTLAETVTKMESKHILIALLVLGPSYMLSDGVKLWIQERGKEAEKTGLAALSEKIIDQNDKNLRILSDAFKQSAEASTIHHQAVSGVDSVVRNSGAASSVTIQGTRLNREQIEDARRTEKRDAKTFQITGDFEIKLLNPQTINGFSVRVRSLETGEEYWAVLYDNMTSVRDRAALMRAVARKERIKLTITGRKLGSEVKEARIIAARASVTAPLLIPGSILYKDV